ncbi:SH3 domain-containing protein [Bradyrhizobium sp.]|uniref:SH3 domain-containing protein n=1 Tax=Bradyrhizobium sp. TaxID=376 RepID=UPI0025C101AC|nr:SH3 domain-containing protein [Bradyrhizobium sp.]
MRVTGVLVAAMLLVPAAASAAPGIVTVSVGMRAGPGPSFPQVDRIPAGARVDVHGCLKGDAWCDVSWSGDRGWVSSRYLKYLYHDRYVYLPDYVDEIDVPVVPFVLGTYWSTYYVGRPWYHRHAYWDRYWHGHSRFATQAPQMRPDRFRHAGQTGLVRVFRRTALTSLGSPVFMARRRCRAASRIRLPATASRPGPNR